MLLCFKHMVGINALVYGEIYGLLYGEIALFLNKEHSVMFFFFQDLSFQ